MKGSRPVRRLAGLLFSVALAATSLAALQEQVHPVADYHQHVYSPAIASSVGVAPITAADLIALLDAANIRRAVVLSQAYAFGNPNGTPPVENERARVI